MVNYRREKIPGGTYFFTVNLLNSKEKYLTEHYTSLLEAMKKTRAKYPFNTLAMVVLPNHLHVIWKLQEGDNNYFLHKIFDLVASKA